MRNASRSGKDHILKLLAENIDQFLPIAPKLDENGDMLFYVLNEDDASAVAAMSKRIADKHNPSMKYTIHKTRKPAPFDPLNNASRQIIEVLLINVIYDTNLFFSANTEEPLQSNNKFVGPQQFSK